MVPALELRDLSKRFGRAVALDGVSVRIDSGAALALLGPNGAGKSTLLRLCATLLRPTRGTIHLFGVDVSKSAAAARRRMAMLGHDSFLYPDLTPTENLLFYARLFGVPNPGARVAELIEHLGLVGWAHRPVRVLSRGLLQRSAVARCLLHEPDLLLLDEPFTGLDIEGSAILGDALRSAHRRGTTIVMSTHDMARGFEICSSVLVLVRGRVVRHGPITAADHHELERQYLSATGAAPAT